MTQQGMIIIIVQALIPVQADDDVTSLAQKVHMQEHVIYPLAINWLAEGRLSYNNGEAYLDGKIITQPPVWKNNQLHDK